MTDPIHDAAQALLNATGPTSRGCQPTMVQRVVRATDQPSEPIPCDECETTGQNCRAHRAYPVWAQPPADQPSERILPPSIDPERLYLASVRKYGDHGIGVMQAIAGGQSLAEVLDFVADHLDGRDHVDDESIALYERAKAVATATDQPSEDDLLDAERIEGIVLDAVHKVDGTCELVIEVSEAEYADHLGMPVAVLALVAADQPSEDQP